MTRFSSFSLLVLALLMMGSTSPSKAQELLPKMDDRVVIDLSGEEWVTTKTVRLDVNVVASVDDRNAGTMRADMLKATNDLVKTDWRLTEFNRSEDQTGLEQWSATYEARVPENQLNGLWDNAKKISRKGMQVTVGDIDFSPTLDEMESARAALRAQIYKQASDQLAAVNAAIPGRNYRISMINFTGEEEPIQPMPHVIRGRMMGMAMAAPTPLPASQPPTERAEKITLTARVVFAAVPDKASPPADVKH